MKTKLQKKLFSMLVVILVLAVLFAIVHALGNNSPEPRMPIPKYGRLLMTENGCCAIAIVQSDHNTMHVIYLNYLTNDVEDAFEMLEMLDYEEVNDGVSYYMRYCDRSHRVQEKPKVY